MSRRQAILQEYLDRSIQLHRLQAELAETTDPAMIQVLQTEIATQQNILAALTEEAANAGIDPADLAALGALAVTLAADDPIDVQSFVPDWIIDDAIGGAFTGTGHGLAMIGNAATFHMIDPLDNYVDNVIAQNGGTYGTANVFAHVGAYAAEAAVLVWAWGAAGGGQFGFALKEGTSMLGYLRLPHVTFGYGSRGVLTWAHGLGNGYFVTTVGASAGGYFTITGIPIIAPGAIATWVATRPDCISCAHSAFEAFLRGMKVIR